MADTIDQRACELAVYMIETGATVRNAAGKFGISKSTVHKDVAERLAQINPTLATEARKVLDVNKSERHIRGGMATRRKYLIPDARTEYTNIFSLRKKHLLIKIL